MKKKISDILKKEWDIPNLKSAEEAIQAFSFTERIIFYGLVAVFAFASLSLLWKVNTSFVVEVPKKGGELVEGVIGTPRFINPLLAISDADRDLSALVYSGLLKATPEGDLIGDLAEGYDISEDGLIYTFRLKEDIYFHDDTPVSADDVIFTIHKAQDLTLKSPKRANWEGVKAEKVNDREVKLILKQPYSPFLENTTMGILPSHIWKEVDVEQFPFSQYNTEPIGSGPYKISKIKRNAGGISISYELKPFKQYILGKAYISKITLKFFPNQSTLIDQYRQGSIESISAISPNEARILENEGERVETGMLPRIFGVFFNQNQSAIFTHKEVRDALGESIDKQLIVDNVLHGYGTIIDSPLPITLAGKTKPSVDDSISEEERAQKAIDILESNGWKRDEETGIMEKTVNKEKLRLSFSISTSNADELKQATEIIAEMWRKIGAEVEVNLFNTSDLNQNVIRTRKYDALLFGEIVGRDLDLYAFWHSSQRNDPGLNIAMYTNIKADKLLEKARTVSDKSEKLEIYKDFEKEILADNPAIFGYAPDFLYILPTKLKGFRVDQITIPSERFLNVNEWYIETEKVWKIFVE